MIVTNEQFLERLTKLFESSKDKHSVYISSKRAPPKALQDGDVEMALSSSALHLPVLFRATNGASGSSKVQFSTVVSCDDVATFQSAYLALLRSQLSTCLKKRDKAKERKAEKLREQARKKLVTIVDGKEQIISNQTGSKRGAGRRKRQRALKKGAKLRKEKAKEHKRKREQQKQTPKSSSGDVTKATA